MTQSTENIVAHTPGPWSRHYGKSPMRPEDEWYIFGPEKAGNAALAAVFADEEAGLTGATVEANARLIAAAPDLLAALKAMLNPDECDGDLDMAMAAIRKALRAASHDRQA